MALKPFRSVGRLHTGRCESDQPVRTSISSHHATVDEDDGITAAFSGIKVSPLKTFADSSSG